MEIAILECNTIIRGKRMKICCMGDSITYNQGYCYTQLTDVMQEINGLLTPERNPKIPPEKIQQINRDPNSQQP